VARRFVETMKGAPLPSGLSGPLESVESADVARLAREGLREARAVLEEAGRNLGLGIASLLAIFDPDTVVILGGLANAYDLFRDALEKTVREEAVSPAAERVRIVRGALGDDAGLVGAALLALERGRG
jgi:glucokinase